MPGRVNQEGETSLRKRDATGVRGRKEERKRGGEEERKRGRDNSSRARTSRGGVQLHIPLSLSLYRVATSAR